MTEDLENYRYCPRCGAEYRAEITDCADCGVALVDAPPPLPNEPEEGYFPSLDPRSFEYVYDESDWERGMKPALLTSVGSEIEADMLVGMLRANDLRAYGQNETSHGLSHYGGQAARSGPLALYRIYVHPSEKDEAESLLEGLTEGADDGFETEEPEVLAAPRSGFVTAALVVIATLLVIVILLFGVNRP